MAWDTSINTRRRNRLLYVFAQHWRPTRLPRNAIGENVFGTFSFFFFILRLSTIWLMPMRDNHNWIWIVTLIRECTLHTLVSSGSPIQLCDEYGMKLPLMSFSTNAMTHKLPLTKCIMNVKKKISSTRMTPIEDNKTIMNWIKHLLAERRVWCECWTVHWQKSHLIYLRARDLPWHWRQAIHFRFENELLTGAGEWWWQNVRLFNQCGKAMGSQLIQVALLKNYFGFWEIDDVINNIVPFRQLECSRLIQISDDQELCCTQLGHRCYWI